MLENKSFPYLIINNFLDKRFAIKLLNELKNENFEFKNSDLFEFYQTKDLENTNNTKLMAFYDMLNSKEFKNYLLKLTGVKALAKIDCSGFIYKNTNYLLPHDDRLETRKLAYVYYLSEFKKKDGGSLDLFNKEKVVKSIVPKFNSLVIFKVIKNKTYHQVSEVLTDKERLSIAGWFNSDK